jgi:hypothetical protein
MTSGLCANQTRATQVGLRLLISVRRVWRKQNELEIRTVICHMSFGQNAIMAG